MAEVFLDGLTKKYGPILAITDLTIRVQDGEFLVLVGPSGSGKTTVLRLIAGLEEATSGRIYIDGRLVNDASPRERDVAMVFQSYALYPHMTVRDNLAFGLRMRGVSKSETANRVANAVSMLALDKLVDRKPSQLSGGERQRVALGRALVIQPKVLLMDEPLSNLDVKLRVHTRSELIKLQKLTGTTVIYVTHDQIEAMTMGTRVAVLGDGVLQQLDAPQALYESPKNTFVAGFVGSPPMNMFTVGVDAVGQNFRLFARGQEFEIPRARWQPLEALCGRTVMFGVRPEHLRFVEKVCEKRDPTLTGRVDMVETTGNEKIVHLSLDEITFLARLDVATKVNVGSVISLSFSSNNVHLFDPQTLFEIAHNVPSDPVFSKM